MRGLEFIAIWLLIVNLGYLLDAVAPQYENSKVLFSFEDTSSVFNEFSTYSVIYPQIHHNGRGKRSLRNTLNTKSGLHIPKITLTYYYQGQRIYADLKLNAQLIPHGHFLRYQKTEKTDSSGDHVVEFFNQTTIELCHYQGFIRSKPNSQVAISTCSGGINGIIFDGFDTFFIHSDDDGKLQNKHFLFRKSDKLHKNTTCGYRSAFSQEQQIHQILTHTKGSKFKHSFRHKRSQMHSNMLSRPFDQALHVELVIVVDNGVYKHFDQNIKKVHNHCKDLAHLINALYIPLNIFIALVGVVIWNKSNEIEISDDSNATLHNFLNYRHTKLLMAHPNDNAQLLTTKHFQKGVVGLALLQKMCSRKKSGSIIVEYSKVVSLIAETMAHEMGHNFGMKHDDAINCKCPDRKCIMSESGAHVLHWSSCSIKELNVASMQGYYKCLDNKPKDNIN